ncbi:MAG: hypothetical protein IBJ03_15355 [Gemmatimonadaceae bacterium]|nr:hypothetical protein [Gemmatimonadaceae bacterium]
MSYSTWGDLGHTAQTTSGTMIGYVRGVLNTSFGIPLRPPPFVATIIGASTAVPNASCNYAASVSGGSPPYTYQWFAGNTLIGSTQSIYATVFSPGLDLSLVVRDASNVTASASKYVFTDLYASGCF